MNPATWGPSLWTAMHYIALGYPESPSSKEIAEYKQFFTSLGAVLPCYKCSVNYKRHLIELPIDGYMTNNDSLFKWTVLLHNIVNRENGKKEISLQEAYQLYQGKVTQESSMIVENKTGFKCNKYVSMFMILLNILTILLILFLVMKYRK